MPEVDVLEADDGARARWSGRRRAGVARGELQIGTWINMARNPAILPLLKAAGLDFARVDMEHSSPSIETIADMALVARAIDFPIAVRPPRADREWITRLLDAGVWNLHCPQVESADHAREIVAASRYARRTVVTASSERVDFHVPIRQGQLVELIARVVATGRTSITVDVEVFAEDLLTGDRQLGTRGKFVLVALDAHGHPTAVPPLTGE